MDARCAPSMTEYETWSLSFSPSSLFDPIKPTEYHPWSHWISSVSEQVLFSIRFWFSTSSHLCFSFSFLCCNCRSRKALRFSLYLCVINLNCSWMMWFTWGLKDVFWTASPWCCVGWKVSTTKARLLGKTRQCWLWSFASHGSHVQSLLTSAMSRALR